MSYERAVRSWAGHLRSGGTSTWREWLAGGSRPDVALADPPLGWTLPGAAQLELVRLAAVQAGGAADALAALADLVLSRSGPGRGLAQQPLVWPRTDIRADVPHPGFGAPPVDPSIVPVGELLRVGVGALTELLLRAPPVEAPAPRPRPLLTRTPAFVLAGAPVTTSVVRRRLALAGHVEGGFAPLVLLLADPLEHALAQAWSARVQAGAPVRWQGFLRRWAGRRELPPGVDLAAQAHGWAERVGPGRVRVVAAGTDATQAVADVLGVRLRARPRPEHAPAGPVDLAPAAVDVARRVNAVLAVRVTEQRHAALLPVLAGLLRSPGEAGEHALGVPEPFRVWARARAEQQAEELTAGRYPVLGSLEVVPPTAGVPAHPRRDDALKVLVAACLRQAGAPLSATEGAVER